MELISPVPPSRIEILRYYAREDVSQALLEIASGREFVGATKEGYLSRPNVIQFKGDIVALVKKGATSFHCSVERWSNPMALSTERRNYDALRTGFDLVIDIDSKIGLDAAKLAVKILEEKLREFGVKNVGLKFSGSRGFHLVLPWEAFPTEVNYKPLALQYPKVPNVIVSFLCEGIREELMEKLVKLYTAKELFEGVEEGALDPFFFVEVERNWGERHLFRAPYSLNEKTWLVSVPLRDVSEFKLSEARMTKVKAREKFFPTPEPEEAAELLREALDWYARFVEGPTKKIESKRRIVVAGLKVPEEFFPPCIKNILKGLSDGRKRSTFTLINFLRVMGYEWEEIEKKLLEWNEKNEKPLSRSFLNSQLNWNKTQTTRSLLPANCDNDLFYKSIGICQPDETCKTIRNPVAYPFKRYGLRGLGQKRRTKPNFYCRRCEKSFKSLRALKLHQVRVHGEKVID